MNEVNKAKDLNKIKAFQKITLTNVCEKVNVDISNLLHCKSGHKKIEAAKEVIIENIIDIFEEELIVKMDKATNKLYDELRKSENKVSELENTILEYKKDLRIKDAVISDQQKIIKKLEG